MIKNDCHTILERSSQNVILWTLLSSYQFTREGQYILNIQFLLACAPILFERCSNISVVHDRCIFGEFFFLMIGSVCAIVNL